MFVLAVALLALAAVVPQAPIAARIAIAGAALGVALFGARKRKTLRASGTTIVADGAGLLRTSPDASKPKSIVAWDAPFGVILLASYGRPNALLAFTTATQTRYLPLRIDERSDEEDELFARIAVLADLDLVDGIAHDAALSATDAAAILQHAEGKSAEALGRIYMSDGRGAPIALDRATLSIASHTFDLTSRLEWRALMFHESTGQAAALYQATWIKQSGAEVVLVAPMPASLVPRDASIQREAQKRLGRALTRDLRLLQSPAETPPARDLRVAIDRPFMLAVRRVLDEAPLASRVTITANVTETETRSAERDSMA